MTKLQKRQLQDNTHIGHVVQFYSNGHPNNKGLVLRTRIHSDIGVQIYLKGFPFPTMIYSDQIISCECQNKAVDLPIKF